MAAGGASPPAPRVLLGLRDAAVPPAGSCRDSLIQLHGAANKLGGCADCAPSVTLVHPACGVCKAGLAHIVQIYCPLEGSPFHRIINVFACTMKSCWGNSESWKVLRSQYLEVQGKEMQDCKWKQKQECPPAAKDWCEDADDWGEGDTEVAASEYTTGQRHDLLTASDSLLRERDCATQFQGLSLEEPPSASDSLHSHNPPGEEQIMPSCVPEFQPYYISVVEEADFLCYEDTNHAKRLLKEYQQREGVDLEQLMLESYAPDGSGEKYEKSEAEKTHQVFLKFMKKISLCPEQILRYSWGGQPLFITCPSTDIGSAAPPCNICKGKRIFEFQLMPTLVSLLKTRDDDVSVEFGTALVYTCEKSCWPANQATALEEFIFVQEDPDQKSFK